MLKFNHLKTRRASVSVNIGGESCIAINMLKNWVSKLLYYLNRDDESTSRIIVGDNKVRTEFILQNIYSYVISKSYFYAPIVAVNRSERLIFDQLKMLVKEFEIEFAEAIRSLCSELESSEHTIEKILCGVTNQIFCGDITRCRVIGFFVFVGELTKDCLSRNLSEHVVQIVYDKFSEIMTHTIEPVIIKNGGWKWIVEL